MTFLIFKKIFEQLDYTTPFRKNKEYFQKYSKNFFIFVSYDEKYYIRKR